MKTYNKYARYFAIEKKMKSIGMHPDRNEMIAEFTEGRTESLRDLTPGEYREFTNQLSQLLNGDEARSDKMNTMRRKVIAILCQCGFTKDGKADMKRIQEWCITHGHAHRELNRYDVIDLQKLITQSERMLISNIERL